MAGVDPGFRRLSAAGLFEAVPFEYSNMTVSAFWLKKKDPMVALPDFFGTKCQV